MLRLRPYITQNRLTRQWTSADLRYRDRAVVLLLILISFVYSMTMIVSFNALSVPMYVITPSACEFSRYTNSSDWYLGDWLLIQQGACPAKGGVWLTSNSTHAGRGPTRGKIRRRDFVYQHCMDFRPDSPTFDQWRELDERNEAEGFESHLSLGAKTWNDAMANVWSGSVFLMLGFVCWMLALGLCCDCGLRGLVFSLANSLFFLIVSLVSWISALSSVPRTDQLNHRAWSTSFFAGCKVSIGASAGVGIGTYVVIMSTVLLVPMVALSCVFKNSEDVNSDEDIMEGYQQHGPGGLFLWPGRGNGVAYRAYVVGTASAQSAVYVHSSSAAAEDNIDNYETNTESYSGQRYLPFAAAAATATSSVSVAGRPPRDHTVPAVTTAVSVVDPVPVYLPPEAVRHEGGLASDLHSTCHGVLAHHHNATTLRFSTDSGPRATAVGTRGESIHQSPAVINDSYGYVDAASAATAAATNSCVQFPSPVASLVEPRPWSMGTSPSGSEINLARVAIINSNPMGVPLYSTGTSGVVVNPMVDGTHAVAVAVPLRIVDVESSVAEVDRNRSTANNAGRSYRTTDETESSSMSERVLL